MFPNSFFRNQTCSKFIFLNTTNVVTATCQLEVVFMCEKESWKIKYLQKAFPDTPLVFDDMTRLGSGRAFDTRSKTVKDVPKALRSNMPKKSHGEFFHWTDGKMWVLSVLVQSQVFKFPNV